MSNGYTTSTSASQKNERARRLILSADFGNVGAESDILEPQHFFDTYSNHWHVPDSIKKHRASVILGAKGTGKTASINYTRLLWHKQGIAKNDHVQILDFDTLNSTNTSLFDLTNRDVPSNSTAFLDAAWKIFIGVRILQSLNIDPKSKFPSGYRVAAFIDELRRKELMIDDYPKLLKKVRTGRTTVGIGDYFSHETSSETENVDLLALGDKILGACFTASTPSHHLIAIDGLDKTLSGSEWYYKTISSLINFSESMRTKCITTGSNIHVVVLCRNDIFNELQMPEGNKIQSDAAITLDWHASDSDSDNILLWDYLEKKINIRHNEFFGVLPEYVSIGNKREPTKRWILSLTRYTPRDITAFFNAMKKLLSTRTIVDSKFMRDVATEYARGYFVDEVRSESIGLLPPEVSRDLMSVLTEINSRVFTREQVETALKEVELESHISPRKFITYLFKQGAIGNLDPSSGYLNFIHRNRVTSPKMSGPWAVHTALVYGLNLPYTISPK